jgi:hypothetical protein
VCIAFVALLVVVPAFYFGFQYLYYRFVAVRPLSEAILAAAALRSYRPIAAMLWHLTAFGITGLVQGFFFVPNDYPGTASNVVVALFLAALAAVLLGSDPATRRRVAALVILAVSIYVIIAMGRSNLYILFHLEPCEAARQPRYHYVGIIPPGLLICVMLARAARGRGWRAALPAAALGAWIVVMGWALARWPLQIDDRPAIRTYVGIALKQIASEIAANPPGHDVYIENAEVPGYILGPMLHHQDFPGLAGLFVLASPTNVVDGRRVYFIERHPLVLGMSRDPATNHRLAGLLVAPEAVAAADP